jgi:hypothetical protein
VRRAICGFRAYDRHSGNRHFRQLYFRYCRVGDNPPATMQAESAQIIMTI